MSLSDLSGEISYFGPTKDSHIASSSIHLKMGRKKKYSSPQEQQEARRESRRRYYAKYLSITFSIVLYSLQCHVGIVPESTCLAGKGTTKRLEMQALQGQSQYSTHSPHRTANLTRSQAFSCRTGPIFFGTSKGDPQADEGNPSTNSQSIFGYGLCQHPITVGISGQSKG